MIFILFKRLNNFGGDEERVNKKIRHLSGAGFKI